jgi:rhodanese-related sulfurtransferase
MKYLIFFAALILTSVGCGNVNTTKTDSGVPNVAADIKDVSPAEVQPAVAKAYSQFVDVRTPEEYLEGHAERAVNIPLDTLSANLDQLEKNEPVYLICQTGNRSRKAAEVLKAAGFNNVNNVAGGTTAWQAANLPMETKSPHGAPISK